MSDNKTIKVKFTASISKVFQQTDDGRTVYSLMPNDESVIRKLDQLIEDRGLVYRGDNYPIKETEDGDRYIKASTKYEFPVKNLPRGCTISDIGVGTQAEVSLVIKEGSYGKTKYVSAYMSGMNIYHFEAYEVSDPFGDDFESLSDTDIPFGDSSTPDNESGGSPDNESQVSPDSTAPQEPQKTP